MQRLTDILNSLLLLFRALRHTLELVYNNIASTICTTTGWVMVWDIEMVRKHVSLLIPAHTAITVLCTVH